MFDRVFDPKAFQRDERLFWQSANLSKEIVSQFCCSCRRYKRKNLTLLFGRRWFGAHGEKNYLEENYRIYISAILKDAL